LDLYLIKTKRKKVIASVYSIIKNINYSSNDKTRPTIQYIEEQIGNNSEKYVRYAILHLMKEKKIIRIRCFGQDGKIAYCYKINQ
jgi:hypothetical protein